MCYQSYRKVAQDYNRRVRQSEGTYATALQSEAKSEAGLLNSELTKNSGEILSSHGFDQKGNPLNAELRMGEIVQAQKQEIKQAYKEAISQTQENVIPLLEEKEKEGKERTVYIGLDDVCNKRQKSSREKKTKNTQPKVSPPKALEEAILKENPYIIP